MSDTNLSRWRSAAALAYHLPGTALIAHDGGDFEVHVAPMTVLDARLHPGELRDILAGGPDEIRHANLSRALAVDPAVALHPEIVSVSPILSDVGLGLFRIGTLEHGGAYAFATLLDAGATNAAMREHGEFPDGGLALIARAGLGYDELLEVTIVVFEWAPEITADELPLLEATARAAQSACGMAEMVALLGANTALDR